MFKESNRALANTDKYINKIEVSSNEKSIFLQAESFYRYRFTPPRKSSLSYLAEAAAAITDFPAFQALAGSVDLQDLRYRSVDASIQLWESLLVHYPKSKLEPFTLYRLGWAYRNAGVQGLPRTNPNEPFDELITRYPDRSLSKLAIEAKKIPWKSKDIATTKSLFPGLAQVYVDKSKSGYTRMAATLASIALIVLPLNTIAQRDGTNFKRDWPQIGLSLTGLIGLSFIYTNSYQDAMSSVVDWNEKAENEFTKEHPEAP